MGDNSTTADLYVVYSGARWVCMQGEGLNIMSNWERKQVGREYVNINIDRRWCPKGDPGLRSYKGGKCVKEVVLRS